MSYFLLMIIYEKKMDLLLEGEIEALEKFKEFKEVVDKKSRSPI